MEIEIMENLRKNNIDFSIKPSALKMGYIIYLDPSIPDKRRYIEGCNSLKEGLINLANEAMERYPDKEFAKWWKEQQGKQCQ